MKTTITAWAARDECECEGSTYIFERKPKKIKGIFTPVGACTCMSFNGEHFNLKPGQCKKVKITVEDGE